MVRIPVIRNRRRCSRRIVHSPVLVSLNGSSSLLYNLSEDGLAVDVMGPPPSELISLAFKLPGTDQPIEASARLAWKGDPGRRVGLLFAELAETSQQRIKEWLSPGAIGSAEEEADREQPGTLIPGPVEALVPEPEISGTIPQVTEAASEKPAGDLGAHSVSQVQPEAVSSRGFASWDVGGWERDVTIVGELRTALFRAGGAGARERQPSLPPAAEQLARRRRRHLSNLVLAVVSGSLVGVALGMGIVLLDADRKVFAGLDNIERSLTSFFTPSKRSIPPNASARPGATKPVGGRGSDAKDQPAPATGSEPAEQAAEPEALQIEMVGPGNEWPVAPHTSIDIGVQFHAPSSNSEAAEAASAPSLPAAKTEAAPTPAPREFTASAQKARSGSRTQSETPTWTPMPGTSGSPGLFTVDTGLTLPARGFSVSSYVNKFSRNPGSVAVLNLGWNIGLGITDWLTFLAGFEPYRHTQVGAAGRPASSASCPTGPPPQLSLNSCITNPAFPNAVNPTIYRSLSPSGGRPGYVEDFPFVRTNDSGVGEVTLGFKLGILSELRGNPVSLGVRNDFIFPTRIGLIDLLDNGTQSGQFNYAFTASLSKTWRNIATLTGNAGLRFTRDPRSNGVRLMNQANQARVGAGIILLPQSRFQLMQEYTGVVFWGTTPNTTFGPRDPVDGVWGFRLYLWPGALDVGYRYMLNLRNTQDRHGFVIKLGAAHWPEKLKPNRPPVASCSADTTSVYAESGDVIMVRVRASDPDGDRLTYTWTASGGRVEGTGTEVRWNSAGTSPGVYTVGVTVDDGRGGTARCGVDIRVEPRPNRPPMIRCSADRSPVLVGERVHITAVASDPDNDPLTYSWRANGGQIIGSGASVELDTSGLAPGHYTVTVRVDDGRGGAADCKVGVDVQAPPPPPQPRKISGCSFRMAGSARVDNECKRILDDVALRLKNEPRATVVIIGYADPKEPRSAKLAQQRGANAAKYTANKGVERSRIGVRSASGQAGAGKENYRIEIIWVP